MRGYALLPQNWKWVNFGDITSERLIGLVRGSKEQDPSRQYPYIKMDSIQIDGNLNLDLAAKVNATPEEIKRYSLSKGDFLFNTRNSHELVGKTAVFNIDEKDWIYNNNIMRVRFYDDIDPYFVNFAFHSPLIQSQLEAAKSKTTSVCAIYDYQLIKIKIPLPPIAEQRRIAAILDKADAIRRKRKQAIQYTEELLRATFLDMFGNPIQNPKQWETKPLRTIASINRGKFTPRPRNDPRYYGGEYPFIQTGDISAANGYLKDFSQTLNEQGIVVSRSFEPGDIVIAIVGATIGETAILSQKMYCPDSVIGIKVGEKILPEFLEYSLRYWKRIFREQAPETARANINLETLRPIEIILPPLGLQEIFQKMYQKLLGSSSITEEKAADELFNSLLQRAFRGELSA